VGSGKFSSKNRIKGGDQRAEKTTVLGNTARRFVFITLIQEC